MKRVGRPAQTPVNERPAWALRLVEARAKAGLTQTDLAAKSGTSLSTLGSYETGQNEPSLAVFQRLADALGVSPEFLAFGPVALSDTIVSGLNSGGDFLPILFEAVEGVKVFASDTGLALSSDILLSIFKGVLFDAMASDKSMSAHDRVRGAFLSREAALADFRARLKQN